MVTGGGVTGLRLVDSQERPSTTQRGFLQVRYHSEWGTVCQRIPHDTAMFLCQTLGYKGYVSQNATVQLFILLKPVE
jgi:hypothetical protein